MNVLTHNGKVIYDSAFFLLKEANVMFDNMFESVRWRNDELMMFGKRITTKRKYAWYGDEAYDYRYSGQSRIAEPWSVGLLKIRERLELETGVRFNSCLMNLYHTGEEGMGWHSDDERTMQADSPIASISLGANRRFSFKHRTTKERINLFLEHGSLLIMDAESQKHWLHSLPKSKKVKDARINLTFRVFDNSA